MRRNKKNKRSFLNQAGFSMIEVMIAAGLTTVVALTISKLTQQSNRNIKRLETEAEILDFEGWIKSRLRNADICKKAFDGVNLDPAGAGQTATDFRPPSTPVGGTPTTYNSMTTIEIKREDPANPGTDIVERELEVTAATDDVDKDVLAGFPSWSLREIRLHNQVGTAIGGKCDLMLRLHRLKGGASGKKRSAGRTEKVIWITLDCNTDAANPGQLLFCAEDSGSGSGGLWENKTQDPRDGIIYKTGAVVEVEYDLKVNGILEVGDGPVWPSDMRYKKKIVEMKNISEKLNKLKAYNYVYRTDEFPRENFTTKLQNGVIAQDVIPLFPNIVSMNSDRMYRVNYVMFVPLLLQAHNEQSKIIKDQQIKIDKLESGMSLLINRINKIEKRLK